MGILFRVAIFLGIIWVGYTFVADKIIKDKIPELKEKTSAFINPKEARADLLESLELKLSDIKESQSKLGSINLEDIEDEEIRAIIQDLQGSASEETIEEILELVTSIEALNDKEGIVQKGVGRILEKILPADETPEPTLQPTITPFIYSTPSSDPPAPQCSWVCEN